MNMTWMKHDVRVWNKFVWPHRYELKLTSRKLLCLCHWGIRGSLWNVEFSSPYRLCWSVKKTSLKSALPRAILNKPVNLHVPTAHHSLLVSRPVVNSSFLWRSFKETIFYLGMSVPDIVTRPPTLCVHDVSHSFHFHRSPVFILSCGPSRGGRHQWMECVCRVFVRGCCDVPAGIWFWRAHFRCH
jgi:hypothetical protein